MPLCRAVIALLGCLSGAAALAEMAKESPQTPVSSTVNEQLPYWLRFGGEERTRMENVFGSGFKPVGDLYAVQRLRLGVEVRPRPWLRFIFEAQDARVFGQNLLPAPASQKNAMDLRLGYVQLGAEEGRVVLRAGRLPLAFGEGRVLADPGWSNVGRVFDAVHLTLHRRGLKVDLFSGWLVKVDPMGCDQSMPGAHFYGSYGSWAGLVPAATLEPYLLWRLEHDFRSEDGLKGHLNVKTIGMRWVGKLPQRFDYGIEMALQSGSSAGDPLRAWAGHWVLGYTLRNERYRPRFYIEFNRASGDSDPRDGVRETFDPLFASTHDKLGLADQFTWTNVEHARFGFGFNLRRGLTAGAAYNSYWLAHARDSLYISGKAIARSPDGSAGTHVGQEADLQVSWTPLRSTQVAIGFGRLFPGEFVHRMLAGVPYNLVFTSISQRF